LKFPSSNAKPDSDLGLDVDLSVRCVLTTLVKRRRVKEVEDGES